MVSFRFETTFPLIAHLIDRIHAKTGSPAHRDQIRDALLIDPIGAELVSMAGREQERPAEKIAGNMVDWWSAEQAKGTNPWATHYDRLVIDDKAAYRPKMERGGLDHGTTPSQRVNATDGQGRQLDPSRRAAVEEWAMADARRWLGTLGWSDHDVTDTSKGNPYDLLAERPGERLFVEVKGTTGTGPKVIVTEAEVRHAEAHPDDCALFVLTGIKVLPDDSGSHQGSGGIRRVFRPWRPATGLLLPISYRHDPQPTTLIDETD